MNSLCSIVQWWYFIYACHKGFFQKSGFLQLPLQISFLHIFMLPVQKQLKQKPCFVWHLIPYPRQCVVTQVGDDQTHILPLSSAPKSFSVQQPWGFPMSLGNWISGMSLVSSHAWLLCEFICQRVECNTSFYSIDSGESPTPSSRAPCSDVPLTVLSQFPQVTLLGLFSVKVQAGCWQVHQQMYRSALTPALCAAQPAIEPMGSLRKGFDRYLKWKYFDWEFYWSHAIKLYRGLNLIALSALGQYTWINYSWNTKLMLRYDTKEWTLLHLL